MSFSIKDRGYTALDIETTGLSPVFCGIVEIAALKVMPDGTEQIYQTLVDPGRPIPEAVTAIHGITDAMVVGQPDAETAVRGLVGFVGDSPLVLHNAKFDLSFINPIVGKLGLGWNSPAVFDTLPLSRKAFTGLRSYSLENLSKFFDFETGGHHRALADCRYCSQLFELILQRFNAKIVPFDEFAEKFALSGKFLPRS